MAALLGTETLEVRPIWSNGRPSGETETTTTQAIANLAGNASSVGRTVASGPVTMLNTDGIVNIALTIPATCAITGASARTAWKPYTIKDALGAAYAYNITYTPASGTIDGMASILIQQNYDSLTIYSDGTNEFTM